MGKQWQMEKQWNGKMMPSHVEHARNDWKSNGKMSRFD